MEFMALSLFLDYGISGSLWGQCLERWQEGQDLLPTVVLVEMVPLELR